MSGLYPEVHLVLGGVGDGVAGEQNLVANGRDDILNRHRDEHLGVGEQHGPQSVAQGVVLLVEHKSPVGPRLKLGDITHL